MFICELCKSEFKTREELLNHFNTKHVVIEKDNEETIERNEIRKQLEETFPDYEVRIEKNEFEMVDCKYIITLFNNDIEIKQIYGIKYLNEDSNPKNNNIDTLKLLLFTKMDIKDKILHLATEEDLRDMHIDINYGNLDCELFIRMTFIKNGKCYEETYISDVFYYYMGNDIIRDIKNRLHKYNVTELIGEWELEDPDYMITPNLKIDGISVQELLNKAREQNKKVKLCIVD